MALAKRPRLLLLDEPVSSLDPLARREFMQTLMGAVVEDGLTVVLSSHVIAELERVCDHLALLTAGHIQLAGEVDDLLASHRLLTGPRGDPAAVGELPGVLRVSHGDRQTTLLVRAAAAPPHPPVHPNWQSHPISLEDLVLAYLQLPSEAAPAPNARPERVEVVR
jgi:ABC-2 type transport system ATP-binding protein